MNNKLIKDAPKLAMKNKTNVEQSDACGCYSCTKIFKKEDIAEWTDNYQTAICPFCNVDCVIPDKCGIEINEQSLIALKQFWFNQRT